MKDARLKFTQPLFTSHGKTHTHLLKRKKHNDFTYFARPLRKKKLRIKSRLDWRQSTVPCLGDVSWQSLNSMQSKYALVSSSFTSTELILCRRCWSATFRVTTFSDEFVVDHKEQTYSTSERSPRKDLKNHFQSTRHTLLITASVKGTLTCVYSRWPVYNAWNVPVIVP